MMKKVVNTGLALAFMITSAFAQNLNDAKLAIDAEQYEKAKGMLKTLVANQAKKGENYFYLGQVYLLTDNPDSARIIFDQGLQAVPKYGLNNVGLGAVDLYKGDEAAASAKFAEATAKLKKKDYEENLYIGRAYIISARQKADEAAALAYYNKAVEYLEKAKAANQKDVDVFVALGDAYLGANRASDAYSAYWTAEDLDKTRLKPRVQRAVISKNARAWQEASEDLKKIAAESPDYAPTYRELAETYHAWGQFATSIEDYQARNQEALGYYKQFMDKTDYSLESRIRYADFLIIAKDYQELQVQAAEMAKIDKVNPRILRYLGYAAYQNEQYEESKKALEDFLSKADKDRVIAQDYLHLGLASIALSTDTVANTVDSTIFNEGIGTLTKAIELDSTLAEDMNELANKYRVRQQYGPAAAIYKVGAQEVSSKNSFTDAFYWGLMQYYNYIMAKKNTPDTPPSKEILKDGIKGFETVLQGKADYADAHLWIARSYLQIDDNPENWQGLFVEPYEKYVAAVKEKGAEELAKETVKKQVSEAYGYIGAYYLNQENYEKAREAFRSAIAINPDDAYAKDSLEKLAPATGAQN